MRGNPLRQLCLVLVAFAAMGWPVWRLTQPAPAAAQTVSTPTADPSNKAAPVTLQITAEFAPPASEFSVSSLGQAVLQGKAQATATAIWQMTLPPEGADLVLHAVWPKTGEGEPGAAAAKINVRLPDGQELEKSFWTKTGETLDEVFTVSSGAPTPQP